ncbi:MAG: zinc ribbon domain-containing protein [Bacillota bacterium]
MYSFTIKGESPADFAAKSNAIFGNGRFIYERLNKDSSLSLYNLYHFIDNYNFVSWIGVSPQDTVKYTAKISGTITDSRGNPIGDGSSTIEKSSQGGNISVDVWVRELSMAGVAGIAVIVIISLGGVTFLIYLYRKNPEKFRIPRFGKPSDAAGQSEVLSSCPSCSSKIKPGDMFCEGCGAELDKVPRCGNCGHIYAPEDKYCLICGTRLERPAAERNEGGTVTNVRGQLAATADTDKE